MQAAFSFNPLDQVFINALERDRTELENVHDVVRSLVHLGIAKHDKHTLGPARNQTDLSFQDRDTSAFASNQRASNVEASIWPRYELIKVVSGDTPRNVGVVAVDQVGVVFAK